MSEKDEATQYAVDVLCEILEDFGEGTVATVIITYGDDGEVAVCHNAISNQAFAGALRKLADKYDTLDEDGNSFQPEIDPLDIN